MTASSTIIGATCRRRSRLKTPSSGTGQAELAEVADRLAADEAHDRIADAGRQLHERDRQRRADRLADDDVRRRANREPHTRRAALDQVVRDLGAAAARPDDEDVLTLERRGVAVAGGVR